VELGTGIVGHLIAWELHERDGSWRAWVSWVQESGGRHVHKVVDVQGDGLRPLEEPEAYQDVPRRVRGNDGRIRLARPGSRRAADPGGGELSAPAGRLLVMTESDPKADLSYYLQLVREAVVWKLTGLSEYDVRRPLTPTGTNLLGLVKHLAGVEIGYFGETFGRPFGEPLPRAFVDGTELNGDMWAAADESREMIVGLYRQAWAHSDATIEALPLDAIGRVPWWPEERREVTLHRILVHVIAETNRHAGQADIVRELIDGAAGMRESSTNMPELDRASWEAYREQLEQVAQQAGKG
jgi:uncharacterized damage-inducible protein DinB